MALFDNGQKILIVDDDPSILVPLATFLRKKGFTVFTAPSAGHALQIVNESPVDLIVSDVNMPEMSGFAMREILLADPDAKHIPFLFLTARAGAEDQLKGFEQLVEDYIAKPVELGVVFVHIWAILNRIQQRKRDSLTSLLSRSWTEIEIKKRMSLLSNDKDAGSIVLIDIDDFKRINDQFGHSVGDAALSFFSEIMKTDLAPLDILGRYGGEEFVLFLTGRNKGQAAEKTRALLENLRQQDVPGTKIRLCFSAGVAEYPSDAEDFKSLVIFADRAMYSAKSLGKGRVVLWHEKLLS